MKFFGELLDLWLTHIRIEGLLHLFFQLILSLPEEDLSLAFDDFVHEVCFFLPDLININLESNCFLLHIFQFFHEFTLKVYILVL